MTFTLRGVSGAALLIGLAGFGSAHAQTVSTQTAQTYSDPMAAGPQEAPAATPAPASAAPPAERVVVIGSLIATTPEDAPKPVEVYTAEDIENQGSPSVSEFMRSLTVTAGSDLGFGQATPDVPTGAGFANVDLRGQGSNGTLVLMNGRRLASTNGGFGADINTIPANALSAVEILKDGASTTYGAGAVGGVVNFTTRRDVDGPELEIQKQIYDGSDGFYKVDFLTGWVGDSSNLLLSLSHQREDAMLQTEREFSSLPFSVNPGAYTLTGSNPGRFHPQTNFSAGTGTGGSINDLPGNTGTAAAAACQAIGGNIASLYQTGATGGTTSACAFPQFHFQDLVNENETNQVYVEFNGDVSDTMEVHFDGTYSKSETLTNRIPADPPVGRAMDASVSALCTSSCFYAIPAAVSRYTAAGVVVPGSAVRNPFIDDYFTRTGATPLSDAGALLTSSNYRPFLFGGIPGQGLRQENIQRERFLATAGVKGEFGGDGILGRLLEGVTYDYSGQYNQYVQTNLTPDVSIARLQNAMLGYGGASCEAIDRVATDYSSAAAFNRTIGIQSDTAAGTNGCQWFNPFASAFATSIVNGAANPQYNSGTPVLGAGATARPTGYANPADLVDWMIISKTSEAKLESATFDATFTGALPEAIALPGGQVGWAVGAQWRMNEVRGRAVGENDEEEALMYQDCPFPDPGVVNLPAQPAQQLGQRGCATATGPFYGSGRTSTAYGVVPDYSDSQTISYYGEVQLPVLDNLNLQASLRREEYNGGDIAGNIWSVAGKWDVTDNLFFRASYGTNFRAEEALDADPGETTITATTLARYGSLQVQNFSIVAPNIQIEEDTTMNVGLGYSRDIGEGTFRASVNYWRIERQDEVVESSVTTVLNNVFGENSTAGQTGRIGQDGTALPTGTPNTTTQYADCSARLIDFVALSGPCVQGTTTAANLLATLQYELNGPGFDTQGIDYEVNVSYPVLDGRLGLNLTATQNLVYEALPYDVNGVLFDPGGDRLGFANFTRTGNLSSEWRANATLRWANDSHNINLRANFTSGVTNEGYPGNLTAIDLSPVAPAPDIYSFYGVYPEDYLDFDATYIYSVPFWDDTKLRLTVLNITDEDPMPAQGRSGYYPGIGNPRGRIVEIGASTSF